MLNRANRLNASQLRDYLVDIVREFVEAQDRVRVTSDEHEFKIIYHISVDSGDLPTLENVKFLFRSLNHLMNKVTRANLDKAGTLDDQFSPTAV